MKRSSLFLFAALLLGAVARSFAAEGKVNRITLPPDRDTFRPGSGADWANALCLTCHSVEYVSTQPPLGRAAWKAIVEKMVVRFGAPVPADKIEPIADYLARTYRGKPADGGLIQASRRCQFGRKRGRVLARFSVDFSG